MTSVNFDWQSYLPQSVQGDVATTEGWYNNFQSASQGITVGPHGTIGMSDGAKQAVLQTMAATATAAIPPPAGIAIGAALELYAVLPKAGAGPGVCATSPPPDSSPAALASWQYFKSWAGFNGGYGPDAPNSFEAFANPVLEYNWLLNANCFSNLYVPPQTLLASLVAAWNVKHAASATRTVTRTFDHITSFGANPGYDPIADAMMWGILQDPQYGGGTPDAFGNTYKGPDQATSSLQVNAGPIIIRPLTLHLPGPATSTTAAAPTPAVKAAKTAAVAGGTAVLAGIAWGLATGKAWDWAFSTAWAEIKDMVGAKEAHEAFEEAIGANERSGSSTQTLLFSRRKYTPSSAKAWARAHGYRSGKVDVTANYIRLRQKDPARFSRLRTITFSRDIKAVIGPLK